MKITQETLEGRVMAQRKVLGRLIATLEGPRRDHLFDYLREQSVVQDQEEDPGVIPGEGLSIQGAVADEMRLILESAERGEAEEAR